MKICTIYLFILLSGSSFSLPVIIQNDNGIPLQNYQIRPDWEESVFLVPDGPCEVREIQVYYYGNKPGKDTIFIVGDPAEGAIPPTMWVLDYNQVAPPIVVDYDGVSGWRKFQVSGLRSDGFDRICIQHRLGANGPWFAVDNDGASVPYKSFLMNPHATNSLGGPGNYYLADGDFLVRIMVEYDYPDGNTSKSPPPPVLLDVSKESGLVDGSGNLIRAADVSIVDWNNDGWDDIAIGSLFFENQKDGTFKNVSSKFNIVAGATSWGDYDNDGDKDCYSLRNGSFDQNLKMVFSKNTLYSNNGNGTFTQLKDRNVFMLPYPSPSADFYLQEPNNQDSIHNPYSNITPLWLDYNNDGWLDLFLANNRSGYNVGNNYYEIYYPDELWINNKNGTFSNVRTISNIAESEPYSSSGYYDCYGANACDFNLDDKADIFVANYRLIKDNLLKNNGDGTFTDVADETGVKGVPTAQFGYYGHGMGSEWGDFNNDGLPDLCVGNLGHPDWRGSVSNPSLIFKNKGAPDYNFEEVHQQMGLKFFEMNAGVCWLDLNLDGYLDLAHCQYSYDAKGNGVDRLSRIYINQGPDKNFKLKDETWKLGCVIHGAWSPVRLDYDNDGDIDLLVASSNEYVKLFRNDLERDGNWVSFRIEGNPQEKVSTDGYGVKVLIQSNGKIFYRDLIGSMSGTRCSQNSNEIHFGIGTISKLDIVTISYPNGSKKLLNNLEVNRKYFIKNDEVRLILTTPQLYAPKNFTSAIHKGEDINFRIYSVRNAIKYELQIADDFDFKNIISTDMIGYPDTNGVISIRSLKLNKCGTYYWKVKAYSAQDTSQWSSVWNFTVCEPIPNPPVLTKPPNDTTYVAPKADFEWKVAGYEARYVKTNTKYQFQISSESNFSSIFLDTNDLNITTLSLTNPLKGETKYYWRVRASNAANYGEWSETWSFTTLPLPSAPILISPEDNETNVSLKPKLKWNQTELANKYEIQLAEDSDFRNIVFEKSSVLYTVTVTELEPKKVYYWRVRGINDGGPGQWSQIWKFTTGEASNAFSKIYNFEFEYYPNPFKSEINFDIAIVEPLFVQLDIFDALGIHIINLASKVFPPGNFKFKWIPDRTSSGIYYYILKFDNKMVSGVLSYIE